MQDAISKLTDEELFEAIREQVNKSRADGKHDRTKTRLIAEEARRRGWNLRQPKQMREAAQ